MKRDSVEKKHKLTLWGETYSLLEMRAAAIFLIPALAFLIFTYVVPLVQVVLLSFTNFSMTTGSKEFIGFENYAYLFTNSRFWTSLRNTVLYGAAKLLLDAGLALLIATLLDKYIPFKKFLRAAYFAPVVVPMVASSLIWMWFYDPTIGPFNQILSALGLPTSRWLYQENTALLSILIFSVWKNLGYNVILFLSGLQNIPDSYVEAARIDGAGDAQVFWKVKFPLLRPIVSFVFMIGIINSFKIFTEVDVMMPKNSTATMLIVNYIYQLAFTNGRMGRATAASLLLFVIIFVLTMVQRMVNARKTIDLE